MCQNEFLKVYVCVFLVACVRLCVFGCMCAFACLWLHVCVCVWCVGVRARFKKPKPDILTVHIVSRVIVPFIS